MKQNVLDLGPAAFTARVGGLRAVCVWLLVLGLAGCVHTPRDEGPGSERRSAVADEVALAAAARELFQTPAGGGAWQVFRLPGKSFAPFEKSLRQGRPALQVAAHRSVSVLRQQFSPPLPAVGVLDFSWRVDALPEGSDLKDASTTDAPVRILLAFDGDRSRWSARTHRLSELTQLMTGEALPYATLSYVWSRDDLPESVLHNPRTDRIRKLVVESGAGHLGQWRDYRRDVRADFIRAFGEEPGPLVAVALMTDTDNTGSSLRAWYGPMRLVDSSTAQ